MKSFEFCCEIIFGSWVVLVKIGSQVGRVKNEGRVKIGSWVGRVKYGSWVGRVKSLFRVKNGSSDGSVKNGSRDVRVKIDFDLAEKKLDCTLAEWNWHLVTSSLPASHLFSQKSFIHQISSQKYLPAWSNNFTEKAKFEPTRTPRNWVGVHWISILQFYKTFLVKMWLFL